MTALSNVIRQKSCTVVVSSTHIRWNWIGRLDGWVGGCGTATWKASTANSFYLHKFHMKIHLKSFCCLVSCRMCSLDAVMFHVKVRNHFNWLFDCTVIIINFSEENTFPMYVYSITSLLTAKHFIELNKSILFCYKAIFVSSISYKISICSMRDRDVNNQRFASIEIFLATNLFDVERELSSFLDKLKCQNVTGQRLRAWFK